MDTTDEDGGIGIAHIWMEKRRWWGSIIKLFSACQNEEPFWVKIFFDGELNNILIDPSNSDKLSILPWIFRGQTYMDEIMELYRAANRDEF